MIAGDLDYAHTRLCARFGERPDEIAWRSIEPIRALPAFLDAARGLPFRRWLEAVTASATPHEIEAALVSRRRALVREVARWMPPSWQAAVEWAGILAELPVLEHLARGGEVLPWMRDDPVYGACGDGGRPPASGLLLPLGMGWRRPDGLFRTWRAEWMRRLPRPSAGSKLFEELARALASQRLVPGTVPGAAAAPRGALVARLAMLFRRTAGEPAAAFIFLALSALDLERLRGELLRRAVFPSFGLAA